MIQLIGITLLLAIMIAGPITISALKSIGR
jgi:hypothetical protein